MLFEGFPIASGVCRVVQMELCTGTQGRDILHDAARVCIVDGTIISQIVRGDTDRL